MPGNTALTAICLLSVAILPFIFIKRTIERWKLKRRHGCEKPRTIPHTDKLLGTDVLYRSYKSIQEHQYLETTRDRFEEVGYTYQQPMLNAMMINTCEPALVKAILATQFRDFELGARRKNAFVPLLGHGIFTTDGDRWSSSRKLLRPSFSKDRLADMPVMCKHTENLIRAVQTLQQDNGAVNVQDVFMAFTLDIATEIFFGESCNSLSRTYVKHEHTEDFAGAFDRAQRKIADDFALGPFAALRVQANSEFNQDRATIHEFAAYFVARALRKRAAIQPGLEEKTESSVVLEELAKHTADESQLGADILNLLVAGRDTTASLLANLWFVISHRPDIWSGLKQEVTKIEGELDFAKLKDLNYLQCCIRESLRMHPPIPINSRTAIRDTVLPMGGGEDGKAPLFVSKNTVVGYNLFAMHRRPDLWESPNEFKPERWEGRRTGWEFLPFNGGPRICMGQQLALTEAAYCTVRLVQKFSSVEPTGSGDWTENLTITCCPQESEMVFRS